MTRMSQLINRFMKKGYITNKIEYNHKSNSFYQGKNNPTILSHRNKSM